MGEKKTFDVVVSLFLYRIFRNSWERIWASLAWADRLKVFTLRPKECQLQSDLGLVWKVCLVQSKNNENGKYMC